MADLATGSSGYQTGSIDTATTQVNRDPNPLKGRANADKINGVMNAIVQLETILGEGPQLKGSLADLVARLAVVLEANGKLKDFSAATKTTFPVPFDEGGTGNTAFTDTKALWVNGNAFDTTYGFLFHGPSSVGAGSSRTHEGDVTISTNQSLGGVHYYTNFTLASGVSLTVPAGSGRLVLIASTSLTINGNIAAAGGGFGAGGAAGDAADGTAGILGTDQAGGGGGGDATYDGGAGGGCIVNGLTLAAGGGGGVNGVGGSASSVTATTPGANVFAVFTAMGGASGGGGAWSGGVGASGAGGRGGASVVLIAPVITFGSGSVINTSGSAGSNASSPSNPASGGGGGGAGNLYVMCRSFTDQGVILTQAGGSGGSGAAGGAGGGAGASGFKQILIYG